MRIEIVSDTICPWCFIGKRRLERALASQEQPVEIGWRPYQLNPDMPVEGMERQAYLEAKFGGRERAANIYTPIVEAGAGEGIAFAFDRIARTPNTVLSHRLIRHAGAAGHQDRMVEALFRAYFEQGRDIGDVATLSAIATEAGFAEDEARRYLESDEDRAQVEAEDQMARNLGIQGVPCFIIDRAVMVSGAQTPDVLHEAFVLAAQRQKTA